MYRYETEVETKNGVSLSVSVDYNYTPGEDDTNSRAQVSIKGVFTYSLSYWGCDIDRDWLVKRGWHTLADQQALKLVESAIDDGGWLYHQIRDFHNDYSGPW